MSPGLTWPRSECTSTPSQISIATFARYSCERCMGLRVWKAATRDQPRRSNCARVSGGVMNSAPYFALNPPSERTRTGPARFTSPCCVSIFTPGCSRSVVRNTDWHSCALSMRYFSVIVITASRPPSSGSMSAISAPGLSGAAKSSAAESVMGIGQKSPPLVRISSQTPCQSARVMKPSSGVKPPMPSITRSPFSREVTRKRGSVCARRVSSASSSRPTCSARSPQPPWGATSMALLRQHLHRPLQSLERGRIHPPVHQLSYDADRLAVAPDFLRLRVEPDALRVHISDALDPYRAGLLVEVLHGAAGLQDLVGTHRRVADEDHLVVVPVFVQHLPGARSLGVTPAVVLPHEVVKAVVEVEELEVLELGLRRREELLGKLDVLVHRAADVHQHQHLDGVAPLWAHVDVEVGLARRVVDRALQVELVRRAFARKLSQPSQRHLDVARAEFHLVIEVSVLAHVPYLQRTAIPRLFLSDAHALRVVAVGAEGRSAASADPFGAALMAALL